MRMPIWRCVFFIASCKLQQKVILCVSGFKTRRKLGPIPGANDQAWFNEFDHVHVVSRSHVCLRLAHFAGELEKLATLGLL